MKGIFNLFLILLASLPAIAQSQLKVEMSTKRLMRDVYFLASDSLGGRKFPQTGNEIAANYIASEFEAINLKPIPNSPNKYFQVMPVTKLDKGTTRVFADDIPPIMGVNYSFAANKPFADSLTQPIKYWGSSIPFHQNIGDTIVHVYAKTLDDAKANLQSIKSQTNAKTFAISLPKKMNNRIINRELWANRLRYPNSMIRSGEPNWLYHQLSNTNDTLRVFMFSDKTLNSLYGQSIKDLNKEVNKVAGKGNSNALPTAYLTYKTNFYVKTDTLYDKNVIGYIEGTDLKDEVLIVGGHFDHVGRMPDGVCIGADDNASGTAGVMELARMCAQAQANGFEFRRSVMFVAFAAEESGLNGSMYYVNNPIFPLEKTVMIINMDMIGRSDNKPNKNGYVSTWTIGRGAIKRPAKRLIRKIDRQMDNTTFYLKQDFPENVMWFMGSDHFPFYRKGIPALIVTTGSHDDYHKPTDTPDKINYENMANVLKAMFALITDVASEPDKYPTKVEK
jgi:hypothetical protein